MPDDEETPAVEEQVEEATSEDATAIASAPTLVVVTPTEGGSDLDTLRVRLAELEQRMDSYENAETTTESEPDAIEETAPTAPTAPVAGEPDDTTGLDTGPAIERRNEQPPRGLGLWYKRIGGRHAG